MLDAVLQPLGLTSSDLPLVNAGLNSIAAVLLCIGWLAVRGRRIGMHKAMMVAAFGVSSLFLASYLYFHFAIRKGEPTVFTTPGWPRIAYFSVLISHTVLAMAIAVLAPVTLVLGLTGRIDRHRRLARWTLPIWLYVSVTGVIVYVMLYRLFPPAG